MCHSNRLTRVACWLADYPEWLQFCWDFVKLPRNDEIALQHFFLACSSARIFFLFPLCCMQFFSSNKCLQEIFFQNHPSPPPQELNGRPLSPGEPKQAQVPGEPVPGSSLVIGHCGQINGGNQ